MRSPKMFTVTAALALCGVTAAAQQAPSPTFPTNAALDGLIAQQMADAGIMGVGAAVIVDRQVAWMKGYGFADQRRTRPFTPKTIMNVGSIAKPFTGVAMLRAVHEGKLSLDEDINTYVPFRVVNPHHPKERITLRHLATHTSGITDRWEVYEGTYHYGGDSPEPLGHFLEQYFAEGGQNYSRENFLDAKPGARREYSNIGAGLAGYIVERAFGEPLNVYTRKHIFKPLQMSDTGWFLSEVDLSNHSTLFVSQGGQSIPIPLYGGTTYPDGGVRTSVADLSRFFVALLNGGSIRARASWTRVWLRRCSASSSPMPIGPRTTRPRTGTQGSSGGRRTTERGSAMGATIRGSRRRCSPMSPRRSASSSS